jgi:hypothetical protein
MDASTSNSNPPAGDYIVWVDDNFHYGDEDERYKQGQYETYEEAVRVCRDIVDGDLKHNFKEGITSEALYGAYTGFGEDPWIAGDPPPGEPRFSAWEYAKVKAAEMCGG